MWKLWHLLGTEDSEELRQDAIAQYVQYALVPGVCLRDSVYLAQMNAFTLNLNTFSLCVISINGLTFLENTVHNLLLKGLYQSSP